MVRVKAVKIRLTPYYSHITVSVGNLEGLTSNQLEALKRLVFKLANYIDGLYELDLDGERIIFLDSIQNMIFETPKKFRACGLKTEIRKNKMGS